MNYRLFVRLAMAAVVTATFAASSPVRASESDDRIESTFKDTYVYRTYLRDDSISAKSVDGAVTLTGSVAAESHKSLAEDTMANMLGVTSVDNQLETKAEIDAQNADTWTGRKVNLALLFHRNVNAGNTKVDVQDGVVTLTGEASSIGQKELTTEYANDIEGVVSVVNKMSVAAAPVQNERSTGEKIDDASVTAQVRNAMLTHRSTSAISIKVTTRDGEVTLTGIAKNDAEKSLVTKLTSDIQGVTSVNNEMTVEAPKTI
jgi:hyperosmotically inducible protein